MIPPARKLAVTQICLHATAVHFIQPDPAAAWNHSGKTPSLFTSQVLNHRLPGSVTWAKFDQKPVILHSAEPQLVANYLSINFVPVIVAHGSPDSTVKDLQASLKGIFPLDQPHGG